LPLLALNACTKASLSLGEPEHSNIPTPTSLKNPLAQEVKLPSAEQTSIPQSSKELLAIQEFTAKTYDAKKFCSPDSSLQISLSHDSESDTWNASMTLKKAGKALVQIDLDLIPDEEESHLLDVTNEGRAQIGENTAVMLTNIQLAAIRDTSTTQATNELLISLQKGALSSSDLGQSTNSQLLLTVCQQPSAN
jgi:hypothetical protein